MMETERLILRRWEDSDAEDLYKYASDPDVGPIAGWPAHQSIDVSRDVIKNVFNGKEAYAICLKEDGKDKNLNAMEHLRYENYDYVMIVCKNEVDYLNLIRTLGLEKKKTIVTPTRKIKARAVWYDEMKAQIVPKSKDDKSCQKKRKLHDNYCLSIN